MSSEHEDKFPNEYEQTSPQFDPTHHTIVFWYHISLEQEIVPTTNIFKIKKQKPTSKNRVLIEEILETLK